MKNKHQNTRKTLIIVPTYLEAQSLLNGLKNTREIQPVSPSIDLLITGAGIAATLYVLGTINPYAYHSLIQIGIGGSMGKYAPGQVLFIKQDAFADMGIIENRQNIPLCNAPFIEKQDAPLNDAAMLLPLSPWDMPQANAATVSHVKNTFTFADYLRNLQAEVITMEGAAFVYYCQKKNLTSYYQIRAISNYIEERNKQHWEIGKALQHLQTWIYQNLMSNEKH